MDVLAMRRQGLTVVEIAEATGYHPATIGEVAERRWSAAGTASTGGAGGSTSSGGTRIAELVRPHRACWRRACSRSSRRRASRVRIRRWPGICGLRGARGSAAPQVSTRIETGAGEECQFDWSDVAHWSTGVGTGRGVVLVGDLVLVAGGGCGGSHRRSTGSTPSRAWCGSSRPSAGCPPWPAPTGWEHSASPRAGGSRCTHPREFARFHGCEIRACQARDAKRKGKVERPFRDVKERFLEECQAAGPPQSIDELNARAATWLAERVHPRAHRTTGVPPVERLVIERELLGRVAPPTLRHRLCRAPPGARRGAADRVARCALLGATGVSGPTRRGPPGDRRGRHRGALGR